MAILSDDLRIIQESAAINAFEDQERAYFLTMHWDYDESNALLTSLAPQRFKSVRKLTSLGLGEGVHDFLSHDLQGRFPTIYRADREAIGMFVHNDATRGKIITYLSNIVELSDAEKGDYADQVCKTYRLFVYQESLPYFERISSSDGGIVAYQRATKSSMRRVFPDHVPHLLRLG